MSCTLPREMKYMARLTQPATTTNSPGRYTSGSSEVAIAAIIFVFTSAKRAHERTSWSCTTTEMRERSWYGSDRMKASPAWSRWRTQM